MHLVPPPLLHSQGKLKHGSTVDAYSSPCHGVWHPDQLTPRLAWAGSGGHGDGPFAGVWSNPWATVPKAMVVRAFTEQLPAEGGAANLQWAMPQFGSRAATASERGSLAVACQDQRPASWLSKPGFLAFGALRSYPLTQMRLLACALSERSLPLGHPAVHTLVQQALFHVGELTDANRPALHWRTDWGSTAASGGGTGSGDMLATLCAELSQLAAELEQSPREAAAVQLIGLMAAYLAGWHPPLRDVARRLVTAASQWADDLQPQLEVAAPAEARPLRAKACLHRMRALLCLGSGGGGEQLSTDDAGRMLCLAVQVHHDGVLAGSLEDRDAPMGKELAQLQVRGGPGDAMGQLAARLAVLQCQCRLRHASCPPCPVRPSAHPAGAVPLGPGPPR